MVYTKFLANSNYYFILLNFDKELAIQDHKQPCSSCGGKLNWANYPRKPRGDPLIPDEDIIRFSLCCSNPGCRKRHTPESLRFLGRKVYLSVIITLLAAMMHGNTPKRASKLNQSIKVNYQTLLRWRKWWLKEVPISSFWQKVSGRFNGFFDTQILPLSLVEYFKIAEKGEEALTNLLRFIAPLGREM